MPGNSPTRPIRDRNLFIPLAAVLLCALPAAGQTSVRVATLQQEQLAAGVRLSVGDEKWSLLQQSASRLSSELSRAGAPSNSLLFDPTQPMPPDAATALSKYLEFYLKSTGTRDLAQAVEASMGTLLAMEQQDLTDLARHLESINQIKAGLGQAVRELLHALERGTLPVQVDYRWMESSGTVHQERVLAESREEAKAAIGLAEERLALVSKLSALASMDLQNRQQKSQQVVQILSAILQAWHETAKGVLSNLR